MDYLSRSIYIYFFYIADYNVLTVVGTCDGLFRVERPLRNLRKDSRNDFLNDLRRDNCSPAPVKSKYLFLLA